ncbi:MAG: acyl-CoA carboxylase epsilon subunit [Nakamurella sp.]
MSIADRDAEDAAAVLVVLTLLADHPPGSAESVEPSAWADPAHRLRLPPAPSASAWWSSGLPR